MKLISLECALRRSFPGPANAGLRAKIRAAAAYGPEAVSALSGVVALTALGEAKLREVAQVVRALADAEREAGDEVHALGDGRWVIARWDSRACQYTSGDRANIPESERNSYCYTYSRTIPGLVGAGIRTYRTRLEALSRAAAKYR